MPFPILDASRFASGSPSQRAQHARELLDHLRQHGFVRLKNTGIPTQAIHEAFALGKQFFQLPLEEKCNIVNPPGPSPQRGWSKLGAEKTSTLYGKLMGYEMPDDLKDAREHFDFGPPEDPLFPNRWPSSSAVPPFRPALEALYARCEEVSHDILTALAEAFNLAPNTFVQHLSPNASEFRINHYPAISDAELSSSKVERIWPHFDLGVVTLLFADGSGVGGLQFEDRARAGGSFLDVEAGEVGEVLVNVSETLQRWTAGELPAGLHRVTKPEGARGQVPERFTMAYFCKAARHAKVDALPPFRKKRVEGGVEREVEEEGITALEYQQTRLLTAY
ncbi:hypothetical protein SLS57_005310 [Botryosphaeria dothidea]